MITFPNWYEKVEDELRKTIAIQANELNISYKSVHDSKLINESVKDIMSVLLRLKQEVKGDFDNETIKDFKKNNKENKKGKRYNKETKNNNKKKYS